MKAGWNSPKAANAVVNAFYDVVAERLLADRAAGRLHPDVVDVRRYAMSIVGQGIGLIVHGSMIRAAGGRSRHTLDGLYDELIGLVERGSRP